jgi:hypothetical protein
VWLQGSPGWRMLLGSQVAGCGTLPEALETICARGLLLPLSLGAHCTRRSGALRCALSRERFAVRGVHACLEIIGGENLGLSDLVGSQFPSVEYSLSQAAARTHQRCAAAAWRGFQRW